MAWPWVDEIKANLPELPDALKARLIDQYGLSPYDATVIAEDLETAAFYEKVAAGRDAKLASNWMTVELFGALNKLGKTLAESPGFSRTIRGFGGADFRRHYFRTDRQGCLC